MKMQQEVSTFRGLFVLLAIWLLSVCQYGEGIKCTDGFVGKKTFQRNSMFLGDFSQSDESVQWIFPYLNFTCDTIITSFKIVARENTFGTVFPALQVWRPVGREFMRIREISTEKFSRIAKYSSHVYESPRLSVAVERGDMIGYYEPVSNRNRYFLYYQSESGFGSWRKNNERSAPGTFRTNGRGIDENVQDFPLLHVEADNPECMSGFLTTTELVAKRDLLVHPMLASSELIQPVNQRRLVQSLPFHCSGSITSITFTAHHATGIIYPVFQIWTQSPSNSSLYLKRSQVSLANSFLASLNTYKLRLAEPLLVQRGDIVGLLLPALEMAAILLQFAQNASNSSSLRSYSSPVSAEDFFDVSNSTIELDNAQPLLQVEMIADCGVPSSPWNGTVNFTTTMAGSVASYSCDEGFTLEGDEERLCESLNGLWSGTVPTCRAVDCGEPGAPRHGVVDYQNTTFPSVANYHCNYGRLLNGVLLRRCTLTGEWSDTVPLCIGVRCGALAYPSHGRLMLSEKGTQVGAVASYSCEVNHTLLGVASRTCTADGIWTGMSPLCVADCPSPPLLSNGQMVLTSGWGQRTPVNTVITYNCDEGFVMEGSNNVTCGRNSQWLGTLPVCEVLRCEELQSPDNGQVMLSNGTFLNSVAYYNCSDGYQISGDGNRTCSVNGEWSGNNTVCALISTTSSPTTPSSSERTAGSTEDSSNEGIIPASTESGSTLSSPILNELYLAILIVIAVLVLIILGMIIIITALCIKRRQYKSQQLDINMSNLNDTSLNNPVYEGDQRLSFERWNPNLTNHQSQFHDSMFGSSDSLYAEPCPSDRDSSPIRPPPVPSLPRPNLPCRTFSLATPSVCSIECLYDTVENSGHHYDTASDYKSSQRELPASPYEIPTPTGSNCKVSLSNIYGSLAWGTYVLTEDQRRSTTSSPMSAVEACRKTPSGFSTDQVFFAESEVYWRPAADPASLYEQLATNRYREVLREQIQLTAHLGSGQFGTVDKGLWQSPVGVKKVAIKTLKAGSTEVDKVKFLQEAAINGQFHHKNVVKLLGVVTVGEPVMIILELQANGDLRNYLLRIRPEPGELVPSDTPQLLLRFCSDIAAGMVYLSGKAFIHRDLAARNILVTEGKACKIGDFGLSRDLEDENYYISHGGKIPVKWTAPEALHYKKYSTASDVWSFGCVMYEIWSLGHKPFGGCTNTEAVNLIDRGFRLAPPPGCSREVYQTMIQCWYYKTSQRPTFTELHQKLCVDLPDLLKEATPTSTALGGSLETGLQLYPDLQDFHMGISQ